MGENNALQYADWKRLKFMSDIQNVCPTKLNETTVGNSIQSLFASNVNVYDWTRPIPNKNDIFLFLMLQFDFIPFIRRSALFIFV